LVRGQLDELVATKLFERVFVLDPDRNRALFAFLDLLDNRRVDGCQFDD